MANQIVLTIDNIWLVIAGHMNVWMYVCIEVYFDFVSEFFLCIYKCSVGKDENYKKC